VEPSWSGHWDRTIQHREDAMKSAKDAAIGPYPLVF
jgi:hypothetical protein